MFLHEKDIVAKLMCGDRLGDTYHAIGFFFHFSLRFLYFTLFRKLLLLTYIIINHFLFTQTNTDLSSKHKQYFPIAQLLFLTAKFFTTISSAKPASFLYFLKLVLYFIHDVQFIHYIL